MIKVLVLLSLVGLSWAADNEKCGVVNGYPEGSCSLQGYVSSVSYTGLMEPLPDHAAYLTFYLVDEKGQPLYSAFKPGQPFRARYYIEEAKGSDALGMVTFASMALSAYNNKTPVSVIYKDDSENPSVFLVSLHLNTVTPDVFSMLLSYPIQSGDTAHPQSSTHLYVAPSKQSRPSLLMDYRYTVDGARLIDERRHVWQSQEK